MKLHCLPIVPVLPKVKSKGKFKLRVRKGNSGVKVQHDRVKTSLTPLIGQYPSMDATWIVKKAQGMKQFILILLSEEAQGVSITDCHAGNPCEISSDLTDENDLPMIGRLYGYDQEERVTEMRTRRAVDKLFEHLFFFCLAKEH
ncbi:hypothetical protein Tco_1028050, partial [Tanacetum coccineum]